MLPWWAEETLSKTLQIWIIPNFWLVVYIYVYTLYIIPFGSVFWCWCLAMILTMWLRIRKANRSVRSVNSHFISALSISPFCLVCWVCMWSCFSVLILHKPAWHCHYQHDCSWVDVFNTTKNRKHFLSDKGTHTGLMLSYCVLPLDPWPVYPLKAWVLFWEHTWAMLDTRYGPEVRVKLAGVEHCHGDGWMCTARPLGGGAEQS